MISSSATKSLRPKPSVRGFNFRGVVYFALGVVTSSLARGLFSQENWKAHSTFSLKEDKSTGFDPPYALVLEGDSPPSPLSIAQEFIPESLQHIYAPDKLLFNISRNMLRQSRPIIGNTQRLFSYFEKLKNKKCTSVLFLGGSVTAGHNAGGEKNSYPTHFLNWLNAKYPCQNDDGTIGEHHLKRTHAQNSQTHFTFWFMVSELERVDLVFIEFNINDHFISGIPHALEDRGSVEASSLYPGAWYFEALLRRLLRLRKPDPVAVITFNADYIGRTWATFDSWFDPREARKLLFRSNGEPVKNWISSLYEVPVFSATVWMIPLSSKLGVKWQFNRTHNPYATSLWHSDACCHPPPQGHLILSLVLSYCMHEEEKRYLLLQSETFDDEDIGSFEVDFTMDGAFRDPVFMTPEEDKLYIQNDGVDYFHIDFTDPNGENKWNDHMLSNDSWKWFADNADNDKFGLIANNTAGEAHVALSLKSGGHGLIEVSYVISYENFGLALAWIDNNMTNSRVEQCNTLQDNWIPVGGELHKLIAYWKERASVPTVQLLSKRLNAGEVAILHICLTPHNKKYVSGTMNKFKILGVRVY